MVNADATFSERWIRAATLIVALALILVGAGITVASAASRNNGANIYIQERSNWCWAAASRTIVRAETGDTSPPSQCQLVKWGKNSSECGNVTGTFGSNVSRALLQGDVLSPGTVTSGSRTFSQVRSEIDANRLVMIRWGWTSGGGHMLVLRGYNTSGSMINYVNPLKDTYQVKSHSALRSGSNYTWTHSRTGIHG